MAAWLVLGTHITREAQQTPRRPTRTTRQEPPPWFQPQRKHMRTQHAKPRLQLFMLPFFAQRLLRCSHQRPIHNVVVVVVLSNINEMARELPRMRGLALLVVVGCRCDYYESLNVPRDASAEKIKAAYRRAALREHPDKQHGRSQTARAAAATRMERLNEAYATLLDPVSRRRYDLGRANPHYHDAYHHQQSSSYQPRVIKVTLSCTLEQLGGYAQVEVDLRKALGLPGSYHMPPLRVFLPPGSRSGDRHRIALPHMGAVLILKLTYETPHPVYSRDGADLEMSMWLPAWYNHPWWRRGVTVRSICGGRHLVCAGGECVPLAGKVRTLICTCMRMCMGICMRMCMCVCMCVCMCMYVCGHGTASHGMA